MGLLLLLQLLSPRWQQQWNTGVCRWWWKRSSATTKTVGRMVHGFSSSSVLVPPFSPGRQKLPAAAAVATTRFSLARWGASKTSFHSSPHTTNTNYSQDDNANNNNQNAIVQQQSQSPSVSIRGGDYAGLMATFHAATGRLIPVPDSMIPASYREWFGDECLVSTLEVLASEQDDDDEIEDKDDTDTLGESTATTPMVVWNRVTTLVYPAVGCGVDNLDTQQIRERHTKRPVVVDDDDGGGPIGTLHTMWSSTPRKSGQKSSSLLPTNGGATTINNTSSNLEPADCWCMSSFYPSPLPAVSGTSHRQQHARLRMEFCFGLPCMAEEDNGLGHRSRLQVDFIHITDFGDDDDDDIAHNKNNWQLTSPMRVYLERRVAIRSSGGTVADGGGLDGRSVSQWLGPVLRRQDTQSFPQRNDMSNRKWQKQSKTKDSLVVDGSSFRNDEKTIVVHHLLPGNLTIALLSDAPMVLETATVGDGSHEKQQRHRQQYYVEVSQIYPSLGMRRVLRHTLPAIDTNNRTASAAAAVVESGWEEGAIVQC